MISTTFKLTLPRLTKICKPLFILDGRYNIDKFLSEIAFRYDALIFNRLFRKYTLKTKCIRATPIRIIRFHRSSKVSKGGYSYDRHKMLRYK